MRLQSVFESGKWFSLFLFDFLFPVSCLSCGVRGTYLCSICTQKLPQKENEVARGVWVLFDYRNIIIRKSLWLLKYKKAKEIALVYGRQLFEQVFEMYMIERQLSKRETLVVPIPLSKKKTRFRGFNQSLELARVLVAQPENTIFKLEPSALKKIRETKSQVTTKNRTERLSNLKNAMWADEKVVRGKNVIVVDDVITTGATFAEARRALKEAGAKTITCLAVAH